MKREHPSVRGEALLAKMPAEANENFNTRIRFLAQFTKENDGITFGTQARLSGIGFTVLHHYMYLSSTPRRYRVIVNIAKYYRIEPHQLMSTAEFNHKLTQKALLNWHSPTGRAFEPKDYAKEQGYGGWL